MNKQADQFLRPSRGLAHTRSLLLAGGTLLALAACNSLTGVNDLKVDPSGVGPSVAGTGGTGVAGAGGTGVAGGGTAGAGPVAGAAGSTSTGEGPIGTVCSGPEICAAGLVCVFGACRAPCTNDADAACAQTSCLTDFVTQSSGCRTSSDLCKAGETKGDLLCGPDGVLRMACGAGKICRGDQTCISGTCIGGSDEKSTPWGKCGAQGKSCANATLSVCDVGKPGASTETCVSKAICDSSLPGNVASCVACATTEKTCQVDGTTKKISGAVCNASQTGFDITECEGQSSQCNPSLGLCQKIVVDENEVTQEQYKKFLKDLTGDTGKVGDNAKVPTVCSGNDLNPDATCLAAAKPNVCDLTDALCAKHPVVCVDWCDAFTYCALNGKKLCGKIGGAAKDNLPLADFANPGASEWSNACTAGGRFAFATDTDKGYASNGADTIGQQCNGKDKGQATEPLARLTLPVDDAGLAFCKHQTSGYPAKNLLGNVREWENSCATPAFESGAKPADACRVRGGSFRTNDDDAGKTPLTADAMRCDYDEKELRGYKAPDLGFRCCDLP